MADESLPVMMKIRIRGGPGPYDLRIEDMETGKLIPVSKLVIRPIDAATPGPLIADLTVFVERLEMEGLGHLIQKSLQDAAPSPGLCPHCGRDDGTHPSAIMDKVPCSGKSVS